MTLALRLALLLGLLTAPLGASADELVSGLLQRVEKLEWERRDWSELAPLLNHRSVRVRRRVALALARLQDPGAIPALVKALATEPNRQVRGGLIFALGQTPGTGERLAKAIRGRAPFRSLRRRKGLFSRIELLEERRELVEALGRTAQRRECRLLLGELKNPDAELRGRAAIALGLLYRRLAAAARAVPASKKPNPKQARARKRGHSAALAKILTALSKEKVAALRWRLVYALGTMAGAAADQEQSLRLAFGRLLHARGESELTRIFAARGIAQCGVPKTPDELRWLPSRDHEVPWRLGVELVRALRHYPTTEAFAELLRFCKHPSFHVRRAAAAALGGSKSSPSPALEERAAKALRRLLADPWDSARGEALVALTRRSGRAAAPREAQARIWKDIARFAAEGVSARRAAVRALVTLGMVLPKGDARSRSQQQLLDRLGRDPDRRVRLELVEALGAQPGIQSFELLLRSLDDPELSVAGTSASLLASRKEPGVVAALATLYRKSRKDPARYELREIVVGSIGERAKGKPRGIALELVELALHDPMPSVRKKAREAFQQITGKIAPKTLSGGSGPPRSRPVYPPLSGSMRVEILTSRGRMMLALEPQFAPLHVRNFLYLVDKGFYDGLSWHRVVSDFVVQGGCPRGDGWGDPGWTLPDELSGLHFERGVLGMPKAGKDTGGCQLFFCHLPTPHLDAQYTVFGRIVEGLEVLDLLEEGDGITSIRRLPRED